MKLYFAAAAAIALFAVAPANAASVMSAGRTIQEDCFRAAQSQARTPLPERMLGKAIAACNVALTGELSQLARAGTLVNRGILEAVAGRNDAAIADFNAGLVLHPGKLQSSLALAGRGYANFLVGNETEAERDFEQSVNLNNEGKFFLTLHLKLLESKIKELKRRQEANQQLIAGHFVPNHVGQATAY